MHCPSERTCTTASLFATSNIGALPERSESVPVSRDGPTFVRLEACHVLRLQAFGALADFKFNSLSFVERLVSVHHDCGKMDENILAGLALDESVALAGVEPLHCSLFFHCHYLALSYLCFSFRPAHLAGRGVLTASS